MSMPPYAPNGPMPTGPTPYGPGNGWTAVDAGGPRIPNLGTPPGPGGGGPAGAFLSGLSGASDLSRRTVDPAMSAALFQQLGAAKSGAFPGQVPYAPVARPRPDQSPFDFLRAKPPITNDAIAGLTTAQGGIPGGIVRPPSGGGGEGSGAGGGGLGAGGSPGGGVPAGGNGMGLTPLGPQATAPGGNTPVPYLDGQNVFNRDQASIPNWNGNGPSQQQKFSDPKTQAFYDSLWNAPDLQQDFLFGLHSGMSPDLAYQNILRSFGATQRGGPGPGNVATGTPVGAENPAGLASDYGGNPTAGDPSGIGMGTSSEGQGG